MATIKENAQRIKAAADDIREVIDLCYAEVGEDERIEDYAPKLARLAVDEPTPEVIGLAPRVTAGGRMISDSISSVRKVYGETRKWNQIYTGGLSYTTISGINDSGYTLTNIGKLKSLNAGHIYLFFIKTDTTNSAEGNHGMKFQYHTSDVNYEAINFFRWSGDGIVRHSLIFKSKYDYAGSLVYYARTSYGHKEDTQTVFSNFIYADLTDIYGSGKEPATVDEFCQDYFGKNEADVTDEEWTMLSNYQEPVLVNSSPKSIVSKPTTVWLNQLCDLDRDSVNIGTAIIEDDKVKIRLTSAFNNGICFTRKENVIGHKYFGFAKEFERNVDYCQLNLKNGPINCHITNSGRNVIQISSQSVSYHGYLASVYTAEDIYFAIRIFCQNEYSPTSYITFYNIVCVDLTDMFGDGNEPSTPDEFTQRIFGKDVSDVTDEEWSKLTPFCDGEERVERGLGEPWASSIPVDPTTILDENGEQVFPEGLLSVGDVHDEIDCGRGVAIKRVAVVDLETLEWSFVNGTWRYFDLDGVPVDGSQATYTTIISQKYTTANGNEILNLHLPSAIAYYTSAYFQNLLCCNSENDSASKPIGLMHYVLATPIEYPLPASWRKSWMRVANGGTERITADGMTLPLHAEIAYRTANAAALANDLSNANNLL